MDGPTAGRRVWSLPHARSAILEELNDKQLIGLLTLDSQSFPEVVRALYSEMNQKKWSKYLPVLRGSQHLHSSNLNRHGLYRRSVRNIDIEGTLPACTMFPGGLEGILAVFPRLRCLLANELQLELMWKGDHIDITVNGSMDPALEDFARFAAVSQCLSTIGGVPLHYTYWITMRTSDFEFGLILHKIDFRALTKAIVEFVKEDSSETIIDLETALRILSSKNQIYSCNVYSPYDADYNYSLYDMLVPAEGDGSSGIESFYVTVNDLPQVCFQTFMSRFGVTTYPRLKTLSVYIDCVFKNWQEVKTIPLSCNSQPRSPALESLVFSWRLLLIERHDTAANYWYAKQSKHWPLNYFPNPRLFAKYLLSLGGLTCNYVIDCSIGSLSASQCEQTATDIYAFLVQQELYELQHGRSDKFSSARQDWTPGMWWE